MIALGLRTHAVGLHRLQQVHESLYAEIVVEDQVGLHFLLATRAFCSPPFSVEFSMQMLDQEEVMASPDLSQLLSMLGWPLLDLTSATELTVQYSKHERHLYSIDSSVSLIASELYSS
jgi:hypothetical protein